MSASKRTIVEEKFVVEYKNELYDITEFMHKHPGGINTLEGSNHKSIETKFENAQHSEAAKYLMKEYKLKKTADSSDDLFDDSLEVCESFVAIYSVMTHIRTLSHVIPRHSPIRSLSLSLMGKLIACFNSIW